MLGLHQQYPDLAQMPILQSGSSPPPMGSSGMCPNPSSPSPIPINLAPFTYKSDQLMDPNMMNNNNGYAANPNHSLSPIMSMNSGNLNTSSNGTQPSAPSTPKKEKSKKAVDNSTKKKKTRFGNNLSQINFLCWNKSFCLKTKSWAKNFLL